MFHSSRFFRGRKLTFFEQVKNFTLEFLIIVILVGMVLSLAYFFTLFIEPEAENTCYQAQCQNILSVDYTEAEFESKTNILTCQKCNDSYCLLEYIKLVVNPC